MITDNTLFLSHYTVILHTMQANRGYSKNASASDHVTKWLQGHNVKIRLLFKQLLKGNKGDILYKRKTLTYMIRTVKITWYIVLLNLIKWWRHPYLQNGHFSADLYFCWAWLISYFFSEKRSDLTFYYYYICRPIYVIVFL